MANTFFNLFLILYVYKMCTKCITTILLLIAGLQQIATFSFAKG